MGRPETSDASKRTERSKHLELSVVFPPGDVLSPGSTLRVRVRRLDDRDYSSLSLRLIGQLRCTVMGKTRWQAGVLVNSLGTGGAAAMPVSTLQTVDFVSSDIPFDSHSASSSTSVKEKEAQKDSSGLSEEDYLDVVIPHPANNELLPSLPKKTHNPDPNIVGAQEPATPEIEWYLELEGKRKGLLKMHERLMLKLPVVFPSSPWSDGYSTSATAIKELKYEGGGGAAVPSVEATASQTPFPIPTASAEPASLAPQLNYEPLCAPNTPLSFALTLSPSSPQATPLLSGASSSLKITSFLTRESRTTPVTAAGQDFTWAPVRIVQGEVEKAGGEKVEGGTMRWTGTVKAPEGEVTVLSKALSVRYALHCALNSPIFAQGVLRVFSPVFLPSSSLDLSQPRGEENPHPDATAFAAPPYEPYNTSSTFTQSGCPTVLAARPASTQQYGPRGAPVEGVDYSF
ncbi:hypothetical protein JCM8547_002605 [Rhodosporidiobolus lusitaniae]